MTVTAGPYYGPIIETTGSTTTSTGGFVVTPTTYTFPNPVILPTYTTTIDPHAITRPLVLAWFRDNGIYLWAEEAELICLYISKNNRPVEKECEEWFPIIARKRIVDR